MVDSYENTVQGGQSLESLIRNAALSRQKSGVLPSEDNLEHARASLPHALSSDGVGYDQTIKHIIDDLVPAFNNSSLSSNYYGFVTGGVTPAAMFADNVVSMFDQNVQVHLKEHSIATDVEYNALGLLVDLLRLDRQSWHNGTFTTGATASNILGLGCGREFILRAAAGRKGISVASVGEYGLFEVMQAAGLSKVQVLSTLPHSSLAKAAAVLGIGRANVKNVPREDDSLRFDMTQLEAELARPDKVSIFSVSCGEVNTGRFATNGIEDMRQLRRLCDTYGAWLHVDGAFGIQCRILDDSAEFASLKAGCEGIELADSIAGDGHKMLNVPYDCGFFLCRHDKEAANVFQNANAAYLASVATQDIQSPLNIGIENSRRFRALPVYASLLSLGRTGYQDMLQGQIRLARKIAGWLFDHAEYTVLPETSSKDELLKHTYMVVLFCAKRDNMNRELSTKINAPLRMFVSGTAWQGKPACRIAIATCMVDEERDFGLVTDVLDNISEETKS
ncbi:pyridoxal phosphate-dependent decarboxylase family protein [Aspergillus glaucus CBS 516.65]|uniref:Tyrosine decarboxylase n=1 Tax=Aspergillus glaucus CBS 516.65 TaxID=1160497 RepID=A0A1L9VPK8_ASPGL|nr:hypothetical protein ASPGLDRAFT_24048 [Aspergillus glaucus CBS 516.65]OJJ85857.1 hypothetical protein ASPGLDRAFT_24048 [Aspergillus glaucus CBS 516.65]